MNILLTPRKVIEARCCSSLTDASNVARDRTRRSATRMRGGPGCLAWSTSPLERQTAARGATEK
eukprot:3241167-Alexandrium_andersonii.AAC.1